MSTKKTSRTVKSPAKEGTIPKEVIKAAVKAVSAKPTIKSLQNEVEQLKQEIKSWSFTVECRDETITDLTNTVVAYENTPWTTITYQRFVRWLTNVTSYFK